MTPGKVFLVGAGPGDPGLITVKGVRCIESADVVVFDRLVDRRILGHAGPNAELIDVGKIPGQRRNRQEDINALLVDRGNRGEVVTRLKGGDPFVFGRGGEEAEALRAEGIPFEVVPGITSAIAAPAYAGIPVTHRGVASSFTVVTGNESPDKSNLAIDWTGLARQHGTLVVLMGWENLPGITSALIAGGRSPQTPVALVQWCTEPYQRTVTGTLSDIVDRASSAGLTSPVVTVIGDVVDLRHRLRWFDNRPLFGKRVLVTRTRTQAGALSSMLSHMGALPIELPTIEIRPPDDFGELDGALRRLGAYDWVIFTSVNAIQAVFDRLGALGLDTRAFGTARVAAIGAATAAGLRKHGIVTDFVPESFVSDALVDGLKGRGLDNSKVLLPRADIAPRALNRGLSDLGAEVEEVTAYRTVAPQDSRTRVADVLAEGIGIATFTSSSTVRNLCGLLEGNLDRLAGATIACIGPITAATAVELGLRVDMVASKHTIAGLVDCLESHFAEERSSDE